MTTESHVQGVAFAELAREYGTPLYVYDGDVIATQYGELRDRLHPAMDIFYSLKANPNVSICSLLRSMGAGAEVSSLAELVTAQRAGVDPGSIVFAGPGKSVAELEAAMTAGIGGVVCESAGELELANAIAAGLGVTARVLLRVNPGFSVQGTRLTMAGKPRQFGIDEARLLGLPHLARRFPALRFVGVHAYLGTRILDEDVVVDNTARILDLAVRVADATGTDLDVVDVGGGLGVGYFDGERDLDPARLADRLNPVIDGFHAERPGTRLIMELGRYLVATAGTYVTSVRYVKESMGERFAVVDGGTHQHMAAVGIGSFVKRNFPIRLLNRTGDGETEVWNVSGPLCTPNDVLGKRVPLPAPRPGDLIGVLRSGAYGATASPVLFLGHGYPAELLVHQGRIHVIRERDGVEDILRGQRLCIPIPFLS